MANLPVDAIAQKMSSIEQLASELTLRIDAATAKPKLQHDSQTSKVSEL